MPLWTNVLCLLVTVSQEKKWRNIRSFRFQSFLITIISTVFLTNWMITLLVIISSLKSVISVWIVSRPFTNLKMIWLSRLVQNKKTVLLQMSRCVTRLSQCFLVMSGLELPLSIKDFTVMSWNPIFQNLNC